MTSSFAAVDIGDSLQTGLDAFFGFLPRLIGFLVVLVIGWIIAKVRRSAPTAPSTAGPPVDTSIAWRPTRAHRV